MSAKFVKLLGAFFIVAGITTIAIGMINIIYFTPVDSINYDAKMQNGSIQSLVGAGVTLLGYLITISATSHTVNKSWSSTR